CSWCAARCRGRAGESWRCAAMPEAPLLGASRKVKLDEAAFGASFREALVHQSVRAEQAARRRGTAATRTRGEVAGGGAKPWGQARPTLVVLAPGELAAARSFRNLARVSVRAAENVCVSDLLGAASVVFSEPSLEQLAARASSRSAA